MTHQEALAQVLRISDKETRGYSRSHPYFAAKAALQKAAQDWDELDRVTAASKTPKLPMPNSPHCVVKIERPHVSAVLRPQTVDADSDG